MTFAEFQMQTFGYECITTFWDDFTIADRFGIAAIKDTYKRSFDGWKHDYKYITELAIVLNHKCWSHYENNNEEVSKVYSDLYYKVRDWACSHLKGAEFEYYYRITD